MAVGTSKVASLPDSVVTTNSIADNAITGTKIATNTIPATKMVGVALYGIGGTADGQAAPAPNSQFYMQAGANVANYPSGTYTYTTNFPNPFPNGLLSVTVNKLGGAGNTLAAFRVSAANKSGFTINDGNTGGQQSITWIAIGW